MPEKNDMELVREYACSNSEPAFAELVSRHINLVHSVALRYCGNPQDAQDVTQAVFVILAQKANRLGDKTILVGWLYETTRFTSTTLLRSQSRRQSREQEAYMQSTLNNSDTDDVWKELAPMLENAMSRLTEKDRTLLALRFFENKSAAEVAATLGIEEWAAHKRTSRAVQKLQKFFIQRGVAVSAVVLVGAISANSVQAAPVTLANSVTAVAMTNGAAAGGSIPILANGAMKSIAWAKVKTGLALATAVLLATGIVVVTLKTPSARMVDLGYLYKTNIAASTPHDGNPNNNLAKLPAGNQIFDGIPFDVRGIIQLGNRDDVAKGDARYPESVEGIRVGRTCRQLHLLHGTAHDPGSQLAIAFLDLHYEDQTTARIAVVYGQHVQDWWFKDSTTLPLAPGSKVAWIGENPAAATDGHQIRIFKSTFDNPKPNLRIKTIDYVSALSSSAPFLVALTVQ